MQIYESDDQKLLREAIRIFVEQEAPVERVDEWEAAKEYPTAFFAALSEQGYLGLPFAEEVGGGGYGAISMAIIGEELAKPALDIAGGYGLTVFAGMNLALHGTERQIAEHISPMISGDERYALGITEPDAGSDVAGIATRATRVDDGWSISGQKVFTTGAGVPGTIIHVLARTGDVGRRSRDGLSVFLVPNDADGVQMRRLDTVGRHMLGTYETFYDDVVVSDEALIGGDGNGWSVVTSSLELERVFAAAQCAGAASATLDLTIEYVNEREQFGKKLSEFQVISHRLAELYVKIDGARLLAYQAASMIDAGVPAGIAAAAAKLAATEAFQETADVGMQFFGGYGYMKEYRIERHWREARATTVTAGTSEIQRSIIGKAILKQRARV